MNRKFLLIIMIVLISLSLISGCGSDKKENKGETKITPKGPISVASKIDTEGSLLGNIIKLMLEENNFTVENNIQLGATDINRKAIINGETDIYPEYTGNGGFMFEGTNPEVWKDRELAYKTVRALDYSANKIVWLKPAPANNTWAIAVRKDLAEEHKIVSLEDLGKYINNGGKFKIAGSEEFVTRVDALPAFEEAYEFRLENSQMIILSGGSTSTTENAAANNIDGVNAAMAYGTDGQLAALGLVVLTDTLGVQPVYEPAPIIREEVILKYPEIESILNPVFATLTLTTLQRLNSEIAVEGNEPEAVAMKYLKEKGFIK